MIEHRTTARGERTPTNETGRTGWHRATRENETHTAQLIPAESCRKAADFYRWHLAQGFGPLVALGLTLTAAVLEIARELPGIGGGR